jgi:hypothetical protein
MAGVKGGDKLAPYLQRMAANVGKGATVEVGFLENATYLDGTHVAMVAAIQEYGAPKVGIPPRPFFRNMIAKESPHWAQDVAGVLKARDFDGAAALADMGLEIKAELQESIIETFEPPLSPVTLMLRWMKAENPDLQVTRSTVVEARARVAAGEKPGTVSTKALVDTGHMLNSIDFRVKEA